MINNGYQWISGWLMNVNDGVFCMYIQAVRFCSCLDIILPVNYPFCSKAPPRTIVKRKNYGAVYEGAGVPVMSQSGADLSAKIGET